MPRTSVFATVAGCALACLPLVRASSANEPTTLDLDVSVPPGLPLDWVDALPRPYLPSEPAVPTLSEAKPDPDAEVYAVERPEREIVLPTSFGLVRILTWDIVAHMAWTDPSRTETKRRSVTGKGPGSSPYPPETSDAQFWMTISSLLRVMLHPAQTSRPETLAYILELGDAAEQGVRACSQDSLLKADAKILAKKIGSLPTDRPEVPDGSNGYESMMIRFTAEELVSGHPYDPDLEFAWRMFLLGTTATRYASLHALSDHTLLRRNAIATVSRLGVTGAEDILLRVVETSDDPVSRMRAIRALGVCGKSKVVDPLVTLLESTRDDIEGPALVRALGRLGSARAGAPIVAYGRKHKKDGDVLLTVLDALSRIRLDDDAREKGLEFLEDLHALTGRNPDRFEPKRKGVRPDVPDPANLRGRILHQFATLALARQGARDAKTVLAMRDEEVVASVSQSEFSGQSLGGVLPTVTNAFLELLPEFGKAGVALLEKVVADRTVDPVLRSHALRVLPEGWQTRAALDLLDPKKAPKARRRQPASDSVRLFAWELLDQADHPDVADRASEWLAEVEFDDDLERRPLAERYELLLVLKLLGRRGALDGKALEEFLAQLDLRASADEAFVQTIHDAVSNLVSRARGGNTPEELNDEIVALLEQVRDAGVRTPVRKDNFRLCVRYVGEQLLIAYREKRNSALQQRLRDELVAYLTGERPAKETEAADEREGRFVSKPRVPLAETIVLEVGRAGGDDALTTLTRILKTEGNPLQAIAALSLGATQSDLAVAPLTEALESESGFVRLCAYESLKILTGKDHFADWLGGSIATRRDAIEKYREGL